MRCSYLSDLHLEAHDGVPELPGGDVLIIAGDLCHARCLDPAQTDPYAVAQRQRVQRFVDHARGRYARILLVAGNHEHHDGVLERTTGLLRAHLEGVTVLDGSAVEIGGVWFFGSTLWTDFGGDAAVMRAVRRRVGDYFFIKTHRGAADGALVKFSPEAAAQLHVEARAALDAIDAARGDASLVVVSHHAPSRQGLNPAGSDRSLDAAYASGLDDRIARLKRVPFWVHGHTHIAKRYRIGDTMVVSNARGFLKNGGGAPGFTVRAAFDV